VEKEWLSKVFVSPSSVFFYIRPKITVLTVGSTENSSYIKVYLKNKGYEKG